MNASAPRPRFPSVVRQLRLIYVSTLIGTSFVLALVFSRPAYPEVQITPPVISASIF